MLSLFKGVSSVVLCAALFAGPSVYAQLPDVPAPNGTGDGAAACNCTQTTQTGINISHSATVNVTVSTTGGSENAGSQSTGQSGTAASGQELPPDKCKFVRYRFTCAKVGGVWECVLHSWQIKERDAVTPGDCP